MANYTWDKLEQYLKQKGEAMERGTANALFELSSDITDRTPVDEGFAKGSWTTSINKMETLTNEDPDPKGAASIARTKAEMKKFKLGDTVYHLSNLVYMPRLEYGRYGTGDGATSKTTRDGYSVQAPHGMVRRAVDNFQSNLDEAIKNEQ